MVKWLNETLRPYVENNMINEVPILEFDNAPWHTARLTMNFIQEMGWQRVQHPPWS